MFFLPKLLVQILDSHEFIGDDNEASNQSTDRGGDGEEAVGNVPAVSESDQPAQEEGMETEQGGTAVSEDSNNKTEEEGAKELEGDSQEMEVDGVNGAEVEGGEKAKDEEEEEYNPLIVRRSRRAIKPTKDIDLYLLGAKFGIDVEGSDADSSDQEFSPTVESDRKQYIHDKYQSSKCNNYDGRDYKTFGAFR